MLVSDAYSRIHKYRVEPLAFYPAGQAVGQTNDVKSCREIMFELVSDYVDAVQSLSRLIEPVV